LRDRLRAGDIWVEGSRQWRAVEDQLIAPALLAVMREAGPLPIAAPATAEEYLAERRDLLERRFSEVAAKVAADNLEDVRIKGEELKITPLKAATPESSPWRICSAFILRRAFPSSRSGAFMPSERRALGRCSSRSSPGESTKS
jgi:hypothetical protein